MNQSLVQVFWRRQAGPCDNLATMDTRTPPQQQRSRDKHDRVLAAAAELLQELPYEQVGTKLIAARAGVAVGSLYRFFVDKQAIIDALAQHWLDRLLDVMAAQLADLPDDPVTMLERLVDAYAEFWRAEPGLRSVRSERAYRLAPEAVQRNDAELTERLAAALTGRYGRPDEPGLRPRVLLAIEVAGHLLNLAFTQDPEGDPHVLAELKLLLVRYLAVTG
jgi:AcrR family transcriptional regulator